MFASLHTASLTYRHVQRNGALSRVLQATRLALAARAQRDRLLSLDDSALRDIGLTRQAATAEAQRPIWDVPSAWLR